MNTHNFLIFLVSFIFFNISFAQSDGLLKNGRSVRYHSEKGIWVRYLEPEEDEYVQLCLAKVLNCFPKKIQEEYELVTRWTLDTEDIVRKRTDDQKSIPFHLKGMLVYKNAEGNEITVQIDINPNRIAFPKSIAENLPSEHIEHLYKIDHIEWKAMNHKTYKGSIYLAHWGNIKTILQPSFNLEMLYASKNFLQIHHLVVTAHGHDENAILSLFENINSTRLNTALQFSEKWP